MPSVTVQTRTGRVLNLSVKDKASHEARGEKLQPEYERVDLEPDVFLRVNSAIGRGEKVVREGVDFRGATAAEEAAFPEADRMDGDAQKRRAAIARAKDDPVVVAIVKWLAAESGKTVPQVAREIKDLI